MSVTVNEASSKVSADHLRRDAYLYVRQSSLHQVMNNTESSRGQYDLRGRAIALGWPLERVIVIDIDQGMSGASAADREGSSDSSPTYRWARRGSCSGSSAPDSLETMLTGTGCSSCAR